MAIKWQPTMTPSDAKEFGGTRVIHYTSEDNVSGIKKEGFRLDFSDRGAGDVFGPGVYGIPEDAGQAVSNFYKREIGGKPLELRVNAQKTHVVKFDSISLGKVQSGKRTIDILPGNTSIDRVKIAVLDGIPDAGKKLEKALKDPSIKGAFGIPDVDKAVHKVLIEEGFDSVKIINETFNESIGGTQFIALRPDIVTVVDAKAPKAVRLESEVKAPKKTGAPKKPSTPSTVSSAKVSTPVKTVNEEFLDAMIRHQIYVQRYSGHIRNRMTAILNSSEEELARRIRDKLRNMRGLKKPIEWQRLEALQNTLASIRKESWDEATKFLTEEMMQLSYQEPIQLEGIFKTVLPVSVETVMPSARFLKEIALSRPFEGRILKDWAETMAADDIRRIHSAIQAGMVAGEDMATIARRVVGTGALNGVDGVTEITRRQVQTIVRTAVQHIANGARDAWFADNADILSAEQFVATLDSRTTPICRSLDGKTFPVGKGPRPPLHFNCRSLRIASIDGTLAGDRPAKPTTEKLLVREYAEKNKLGDISSRDELPHGTKADYNKWARGRIRELVGPIPASTDYQTWLKGQSGSFQDEVLGVTKAKLFRDGGLTLDKFVHRNGDELTLGELAQKHSDAFRAAGLDPERY